LLARSHRSIFLLAAFAGFLLSVVCPAAGPAQTPGVGVLQQRQAALAAQEQAAVVQLYGLESRLSQARSDLAHLDARAAALTRKEQTARRELRAAQKTLLGSQRRLAAQLRYLYEHGEPDTIAVILGATSLDEAINGLETAKQTARASQMVLEQSRAAKRQITQVRATLAVQVREAQIARDRVAATAADLEQARSARTSYIASLRQEQQLTAAQIGRLQEQARAAAQKARQVQQQTTAQPATQADTTTTTTATASTTTTDAAPSEPPPPPAESVSTDTTPAPTEPPPAPARPGTSMTVYATGYCLRGTTATGLPVGPGIVATDPRVIPLGTRMTIPGYGEGVAADTGGAIVGKRIDVWIANCKQAGLFNRTVTITFH
jgi:3D (Asp-Asp-Asp) domain-containing protein/peptidoglycan hydrolase CwlO-like protein